MTREGKKETAVIVFVVVVAVLMLVGMAFSVKTLIDDDAITLPAWAALDNLGGTILRVVGAWLLFLAVYLATYLLW